MARQEIRIARNDPGLAHAVARDGLERMGRASRDVFVRAASEPTLKRAFRVLRGHFGPLVVGEDITRPTGSRATGALAALVATDAGDILELLYFPYKAKANPNLRAYCAEVSVSTHALARLLQRTIGTNDLGAAGARIGSHVITAYVAYQEALRTQDTTPSIGDELTVAGEGGALIFALIEGAEGRPHLRALTWIGEETAADPQLRAFCQQKGLKSKWKLK